MKVKSSTKKVQKPIPSRFHSEAGLDFRNAVLRFRQEGRRWLRFLMHPVECTSITFYIKYRGLYVPSSYYMSVKVRPVLRACYYTSKFMYMVYAGWVYNLQALKSGLATLLHALSREHEGKKKIRRFFSKVKSGLRTAVRKIPFHMEVDYETEEDQG